MPRPSFILTKCERRNLGNGLDALIPRYEDAYIARFKWSGLPEGCPEDYIERSLFWYGGIGAKRIKGIGAAVMAAAPSRYSFYNHPVRWIPAGISPVNLEGSPDADIFQESDMPMLWLGTSASEKITPFVEIQRKAVNALNQNMAALSMPILLEVQPGAELNAKLIKQNLGSGEVFLQTVDKASLGAEVLDMHAQDHSQNLISVIHDCDSTILDMLHIRAALEKTSGISEQESIASEQQLTQGMELDLRMRRRWCEEVKNKLGLSLSVELVDEQKAVENEPGNDEKTE